MKAYVTRSYGSRGEIVDVEKPVPAADEVLVRIRATSVNPADWHLLRGEPYVARLLPGIGIRRPRYTVLGCDMAGVVEEVGADVTRFSPGDDVYALMPAGGFAEYVTVHEAKVTAKPKNLSHEQAAAMPMGAVTALLALREHGRVQAGQRVLVNGASGGVGTFAVQIARAFGAEVVGVCGKRNADLVRSLGAADVIDYHTVDFARSDQRFDVLLDIAGGRSVPACRRILEPKGVFVVIGGPAGRWVQPAGHAFTAMAAGPFVSQRVTLVQPVGGVEHLAALTELVEDGKVTPVIDRCYPFAEIAQAVDYQEAGHASGKVVVTV